MFEAVAVGVLVGGVPVMVGVAAGGVPVTVGVGVLVGGVPVTVGVAVGGVPVMVGVGVLETKAVGETVGVLVYVGPGVKTGELSFKRAMLV